MAKFEQDAADFKADMKKLGILPAGASTIAEAVGLSQSHVSNLLNGTKRYTPGFRTKIEGLIAAKGNGPVAQSVVDEADDATEPAGEDCAQPAKRYEAVDPNSEESISNVWVIVEIEWKMVKTLLVPDAGGERMAKHIASVLNKEAE